MAQDDRVDTGYDAPPLVADRMEIGVANPTEEDLRSVRRVRLDRAARLW